MLNFILRRILISIPTLLLVSVLDYQGGWRIASRTAVLEKNLLDGGNLTFIL